MNRSIGLLAPALAFVCIAAAQETPQMDFSLQYDYLRSSSNNGTAANIINGQIVTYPNVGGGNNNYNGAGGQFGYNFNKWISGVADVYAVHLNAGRFGPWTDPVTGFSYNGGHADLTSFQYQFGPRVYVRKFGRFTPFAEFLLGGANAHASIPINLSSVSIPPGQTVNITAPNGQVVPVTFITLATGQTVAVTTNANGQPVGSPSINVPVPLRPTNYQCNQVLKNGTCNVATVTSVRAQKSQNVFAYNVGGGVDITINHYLRFRPIEVDMQYTNFTQLHNYGNQNQYNFRYSTGMVFTFGKID